MRASRTKLRSEHKGKKLMLIILFVIILPAISILMGYLGTKFLILPNLFASKSPEQEASKPIDQLENIESKPVEPTADNIAKEAYINTLELKKMKIYSLQLGNFSTIENARALVHELNAKKMGAYIYEDKGAFKVLTLSMLNRNNMDSLTPSIMSEYKDAFVITTDVPVRAIEYGKDDSQYVSILEEQNKNLIQVFEDISNNIYLTKTDISKAQEVKENFKSIKVKLSSMTEQLESKQPSSDMKNLHDAFVEMIKTMDNHVDHILNNKEDIELSVAIQNILMDGLFKYLHLITQNGY